MYQYKALNGENLVESVKLPVLVESVFDRIQLPFGLVGVDTDTGLVQVRVTPTKIQDMKLGRLLKRLGLDEEYCKSCSELLKDNIVGVSNLELQFTKNGEEAYHVYSHGPRSCMSDNDAIRCIDSVDVTVAYIQVGDKIISRAIVSTNKDAGLTYTNVYGNIAIEKLLEEVGYEEGDLHGCTLGLIESYSGFLCPYLDSETFATVNKGRLELDGYGDYTTQNTSGDLGSQCSICGCICMHEEVFYSEYDEGSLCYDCYEENYVRVGHEYYHRESSSVVDLPNGDHILAEDAVYSEYHGEYIHVSNCSYSDYSEDYYYDHEVVNAITNVKYPEGEPCLKTDCTYYNNKYIHDDVIYEYTNQDLFNEED